MDGSFLNEYFRKIEKHMILDLNKDEIPNEHFDICIVGAGPAGTTVASHFASKRLKILLLEGGDLTYTEDSQSLLDCGNTGMDAWPNLTRQRYFGGTSNHWSGRCRPFDKSDFYSKLFQDIPGWPIEYAEIEPFLDEAMSILDLPDTGFSPINVDFLDSRFEPDEFALSPPTRFGQKYYELFDSSKNITVGINANAIDLELNDGHEKVILLKIANYKGRLFSFKSSQFVLAMGGIENPRFLLNCDKQIKNGIGNQGDMVGKCFMEHLNVKLGEYVMKESTSFHKDSFQYYSSTNLIKNLGIGSANISFGVLKKIKSYGRTAKIKSFFKTLACDLSFESKLEIISNFDCPGTGIIGTLIEQSPGKQSYVKIIDERDKLGMQKAVLNWQLNEYDFNTIRTTAIEIAKAFADAGIGLIKLEDYITDDSLLVPVSQHAHHMGTTRMSESFKNGVVDTNCKVFGVDNLYVAGSSIFATGGACNPTMPIIQFALRLASYLEKILVKR